ncbi:hypothetical protein EDC90_1001284 [Martelella mediterranea]|uniref:Uncharacterized protein n=1 Tax=Martelella mediterranea TaxID=293089 RepID=A0A4R3NZV8_9HYPH|nr:hypothetical protein EDC90_1001284 [Martelella mediterranea]
MTIGCYLDFEEPVAMLIAKMGNVDFGQRIAGFNQKTLTWRNQGQTLLRFERR